MRFFVASLTLLAALAAGPAWSLAAQQPAQSRAQARAKTDDGPYVVWEGDRATVHWAKGGGHVSETFQAPFALALPGIAPAKLSLDGRPYPEAPWDVPRPQKVFAVSDVHGAFDVMRSLLIAHKVIDSKNRWKFGKGHLVIAGDIADRGDKMTEAYWFVRALEASAAKAGGGVHMLIGNHEAMLLTGDYRYINPLYAKPPEGMPGLSSLWGEESELGRWLRSRPMMVKLGDTLFLHGGISPAFLAKGLDMETANRSVRYAPREERSEMETFLLGSSGPLWYRGLILSDQPDSITQEGLGNILAHFGAKRIAVGHTTVVNAKAFHGGKVIAVDGGIQHGRGEGVYIDKKRAYRAMADGTKVGL